MRTYSTPDSHIFSLPPDKIPFQENALKEGRSYEPATSRALYMFLKPGMRVVEAGACCGYHTLSIANIIGSHGSLDCFEANIKLIDYLKHNININGYSDYVNIHNIGIWNDSVDLQFPILDKGLGGASFKNRSQLSQYPTTDVKMTSLDNFNYLSPGEINFLRMDIEGAELEALLGADNLLSSSRPTIVMEWILSNTDDNENHVILNLLQKYGYRIYRLHQQDMREITQVSDLTLPDNQSEDRDVLCITQRI